MTENDTIELLRGMQNKEVDYAEMVGAPAFAYGHKYVYPYPQDYAIEEAIDALKEIQQYREIGTVEELKQLKEILPYLKSCRESLDSVVKRCNKYEQIGTVEECREAVEKYKSLVAYMQQVVWERDIAIQQFEEMRVSLCDKIDSVKKSVEVLKRMVDELEEK